MDVTAGDGYDTNVVMFDIVRGEDELHDDDYPGYPDDYMGYLHGGRNVTNDELTAPAAAAVAAAAATDPAAPAATAAAVPAAAAAVSLLADAQARHTAVEAGAYTRPYSSST